jgi:hypothetical protein
MSFTVRYEGNDFNAGTVPIDLSAYTTGGKVSATTVLTSASDFKNGVERQG